MNLDYPRIEAASDHALLVSFGHEIDAALNQQVRRLFLSLESAPARGVVNLHPAYASLLVDFNPLEVSFEDLEKEVRQRLSDEAKQPPASRLVEVPVFYGSAFGPDLEDVAAHCQMTAEQVTQRHSAAEYIVYFLGFSPGFPYLGGMDQALSTPRLESPRKSVPAGSVAIGGGQTGIYPLASPGGWRIIGRTPLQLFDPHRTPSSLLQMGDRVRFRALRGSECCAYG